ncbi:MAG TPA: RagB/SusD family nutrient uptake outer membrane protein, partial [Gemmatimonadales bacterium]|nr:RagB/SusD family nutrient uptake outer membrane protein [Gemmatimonadales bacterium]
MRNAAVLLRGAIVRAGLVGLPLLGLAGCDKLLEVQAPSRVLADSLKFPASAKLLVDGARAAFGCALQAYINGTGLLTDEMEDTQLAAAAWPWDRRDWNGSLGQAYAEGTCNTGQAFGVYTPLQTARYSADDAIAKITGFPDSLVLGKTLLLAQANLLAGYTRILLGEGFCSAAIDLGPQLFPTDFFQQAEVSFTAANDLAQASGDTVTGRAIGRAALVGRARALLDQAQLPGQQRVAAKYLSARTDALAVPAGFVYALPYNAASSYARNNIAQRNRLDRLYGVAVNYRNLSDPRVKVTNSGQLGADRVSIVWWTDKYSTVSTPISLARYEEAQLIVAEADWAAGDGPAAIARLNTLRGRPGIGLPPYLGAPDTASVRSFLISERARELFLEGQHFWDINRFTLPLDPPADAPYP